MEQKNVDQYSLKEEGGGEGGGNAVVFQTLVQQPL